jgi:hypothetical protein
VLKKALPPGGEKGSIQEKAPPLAGRKERMGEGSRYLPRVDDARHMVGISRGEISYLLLGTHMEDARRYSTTADLQMTSLPRQGGNDGQDRLVVSHQCSAPDGLKDSMLHSPAGLRHLPRLRDICLACSSAIVVSP